LRREFANRARPTKSVAVFADPVFEESDERVREKKGSQAANPISEDQAQKTEKSSSRALLRRAVEFSGSIEANGTREDLRIARLPFTRFEAEAILAAEPRQQSLRATDFRANRETATSAELSNYRFVHFATHAILNSHHPELSGIVLSLVNDEGKPVDGFLRLHDIYNLNLAADLVVLSACQTGLGKEIRGEGLVGLTRGFMYAGAPRVVASLWKVDDAATAEFMKRFYAGMLKDNLRPAAALRRAKIDMSKQKRGQSPYYWAAFELQGEWR
jgi:CHAT domain-containing protein